VTNALAYSAAVVFTTVKTFKSQATKNKDVANINCFFFFDKNSAKKQNGKRIKNTFFHFSILQTLHF
jgi:hypothetical protein